MADDAELLFKAKSERVGTRQRGSTILSLLSATVFGALAPSTALHADDIHVLTFGGASVFGNYYAIANAICDQIDLGGDNSVRCSPEATAGSLYNLFALNNKELDFALVQSDWQRKAVEGTGAFAGIGPQTELLSLMTLFSEAFTIVVRKDAGISTVTDLEGKIIDIGHPTTARRGTVDRLLTELQLPDDFFAEIRALSGNFVASEICEGRIDATVLVIGHPNENLAQVMNECDLKIIPVQGPRIGDFITRNSDYSRFSIPAGTYEGMDQALPTFSVSATLVTRTGVSDAHVELILDTVLDRYTYLKEAVDALPAADESYDQLEGLTAPLHRIAAETLVEQNRK